MLHIFPPRKCPCLLSVDLCHPRQNLFWFPIWYIIHWRWWKARPGGGNVTRKSTVSTKSISTCIILYDTLYRAGNIRTCAWRYVYICAKNTAIVFNAYVHICWQKQQSPKLNEKQMICVWGRHVQFVHFVCNFTYIIFEWEARPVRRRRQQRRRHSDERTIQNKCTIANLQHCGHTQHTHTNDREQERWKWTTTTTIPTRWRKKNQCLL